MKNTRPYLMIALSLMAGLAAVVIGAKWLSGQASVSTRPVIVAARDLDLGSPLDASKLQSVRWPAASIPEGAHAELATLDSRVLRTSVLRGEPIVEGKLAPVGTKGGLSAVINSGRRAISVKVNEVVGVAGFALPGNYVDVLVNIRDERDKPVSKIVLEHILVLAIAQEAARDETKPKVVNAVTLEVTPEQAERLDLARSIGSLSLALRNQVDQSPVGTAGVRQNDLLQVAAPATAANKPAPARRATTARPDAREHVEIIRGVAKSNAAF